MIYYTDNPKGSDLHFYRGHLKCTPDFICGHEFVGTLVEKGEGVTNFDIGDQVVVPFFTACQECYYCVRGQASRCFNGELFGNSFPANTIDGGQAEYVRVPLAQSTCVKTPRGKFFFSIRAAGPMRKKHVGLIYLQAYPKKCWS